MKRILEAILILSIRFSAPHAGGQLRENADEADTESAPDGGRRLRLEIGLCGSCH